MIACRATEQQTQSMQRRSFMTKGAIRCRLPWGLVARSQHNESQTRENAWDHTADVVVRTAGRVRPARRHHERAIWGVGYRGRGNLGIIRRLPPRRHAKRRARPARAGGPRAGSRSPTSRGPATTGFLDCVRYTTTAKAATAPRSRARLSRPRTRRPSTFGSRRAVEFIEKRSASVSIASTLPRSSSPREGHIRGEVIARQRRAATAPGVRARQKPAHEDRGRRSAQRARG